MKQIIVLILTMIFTAAPLMAADEVIKVGEVVVTATRMEMLTSEVGSSVTVISGEDIAKKQETTVLEVLRGVPGLDVVQNGGPGGTTAIFMRGAKSEHTLVMVDGVEMNDPISAGRAFNFADITIDNIERIEVIRGPQSTLYGSDAIGGVINIITKKGKGKPTFFVSGEGGSFNTFKEGAGLNGSNDLFNYSLSVSRLDTEGISVANEKDGNSEKDGYENTSVSSRLGLTPTDNLDVDFILRYNDAKTDLDNSGGVSGDDPNYRSETKQTFFRTVASIILFDELWEQKAGISFSNTERDLSNDTDPAHLKDLSRGSFDGQSIKFDWQHNLYLHKSNTITFGLETEEDKGKSDYYSESVYGPYSSTLTEQKARTSGYYLQDQIKLWNSFFTTLGVRLDDHSKFGSEVTYRIASSYLVQRSGTRLKATYGTGFKAPSLYQLFAPATDYGPIGNENLKPEGSKGWDVGFEQGLLDDKLMLGATYFNNSFDELIDFDYAQGYMNISKAVSNGVESFVSLKPIEELTLTANYTYTHTEDKSTGDALYRRAKNKLGVDISYSFPEKGDVNLGIIYVGKRDNKDFSTYPETRVALDSYTLVNLAGSYRITKNVAIFGRIDNIFDEEYEEVLGYGTPGLSAYAGIKFEM